MTQINRIYGSNGVQPVRHEPRLDAAGSGSATPRPQDQVEISEAAQLLSKMSQLPEIRQDKVDEIRQAILQGDYETPDKIDVVVDRLLQELSGEPEAF